jgi:Integrase core domain
VTASTNAVIESLWSRMQVELLDRKRWKTRIELASAIFEYLEIFHNRRRRHSSLSMLTPIEFKARHQPTTAVRVHEPDSTKLRTAHSSPRLGSGEGLTQSPAGHGVPSWRSVNPLPSSAGHRWNERDLIGA